MTNYERIKNMSIEEMTRLFGDMAEGMSCGDCPAEKACELGDSCVFGFAKWLGTEMEVSENDR